MRLPIFILLIIYTTSSRFFLIDKIPPITDQTVISGRLLSAAASITAVLLIYFLVKNYFKNTKIALLASWVFSVLPWTFEQGRLVSGPNYALNLILIIIYLMQKIKSGWKYMLLFLIPLSLYISYPQFWMFKATMVQSLSALITNISILSSFDFLFFKNITFWWGGVREFGIMFLTFLPVFLIGIYQLVIRSEKKLLTLYVLAIFIAALSPFFPESREFYLVTPLISLTVALGFYQWSLQENKIVKAVLCCLVVLMTYEMSQFIHFYLVHYPQQIIGNLSQIHEAF